MQVRIFSQFMLFFTASRILRHATSYPKHLVENTSVATAWLTSQRLKLNLERRSNDDFGTLESR